MSTTPSQFSLYGGYYSVLIDGVEFARFAPSSFWADYATQNNLQPGVDYIWVVTE